MAGNARPVGDEPAGARFCAGARRRPLPASRRTWAMSPVNRGASADAAATTSVAQRLAGAAGQPARWPAWWRSPVSAGRRRCSRGCSALLLSGALSWLRERRLEATGRYLAALAEGREAVPPPEFGPLGGEELATALHRLDRALAEQRERRAETDRLLATLLDALPDPLLLVGHERSVVGANKAATALFGHRPGGPADRGQPARSGAARGGRRGARGSWRGAAHDPAAGTALARLRRPGRAGAPAPPGGRADRPARAHRAADDRAHALGLRRQRQPRAAHAL